MVASWSDPLGIPSLILSAISALFSYPRGFAPRTPLHALSRAAAPARSDCVARSHARSHFDTSVRFMRQLLLSCRKFSEEARRLSRVAHLAVALADRFDQHGVFVAIDQQSHHSKPVAGCLSLGPERAAGPAEEGRVAGRDRAVQRLLVHEANHQHFAGPVVL